MLIVPFLGSHKDVCQFTWEAMVFFSSSVNFAIFFVWLGWDHFSCEFVVSVANTHTLTHMEAPHKCHLLVNLICVCVCISVCVRQTNGIAAATVELLGLKMFANTRFLGKLLSINVFGMEGNCFKIGLIHVVGIERKLSVISGNYNFSEVNDRWRGKIKFLWKMKMKKEER